MPPAQGQSGFIGKIKEVVAVDSTRLESLKAQLGTPDMRLPIQYALLYPHREPSPAAAPDLAALASLTFRIPDERRFPALRIARAAGRIGSRASAALIAKHRTVRRNIINLLSPVP